MCIGEKISELRKLNKLTQRDLAEKLNVSDKVISK
ncbi:MAG: helix-turn-helix transcriptional regulator [Clostridia bacterium]|nr:helix-turn-helix transcriptional regulator [Clostridia bacterium]